MQTSFIYSASRTNTLSEALLTRTDIDRLLVASPGEGLHTALKETYLAPYLLKVEEKVPEAIELQLKEAKEMVAAVAPRLLPVEILWLRHDIHNLRLFAKAAVNDVSFEVLESHVATRGQYEPSYLYERAQSQLLNGLEAGWQDAYDEAVRSAENNTTSIDTLFDQLYFKTIVSKAERGGDAFLKRFVRAQIDLYNLKARLRTILYPQVASGVVHISGGSFAANEIETKEQIMTAYQALGGEAMWREAVEFYLETKNTTQLDARADDYLLTITREAAYDMFSAASLVLYYLRSKQAAANIRTVITLRDGGLAEDTIRPNLRLAYVKE